MNENVNEKQKKRGIQPTARDTYKGIKSEKVTIILENKENGETETIKI